ncbi:MAG: gluconate 2-dehydrogenase subunit 3 family protein [Vicinamibacteraceae bacterium]
MDARDHRRDVRRRRPALSLGLDRRTSLAALSVLTTHALFPRLLAAWSQTQTAGTPAGAGPATAADGWRPRALDAAGGAQLAAVVDAILPDTDTPGARAAGVHVFIDLAVAECLSVGDQDAFRTGLASLDASCRRAHGAGLDTVAPAALSALLREAEAAGTPFVKTVKGLTVLGYGTSRIGATQALADDPSPGRYRGCIDLAPGQRTWAER